MADNIYENDYLEEGYLEDQDDYVTSGPVIYWNEKVIVIPRNMLEHVEGNIYQLDVHMLKKLLTYLEASEMGIAHDKIIYHETETELSGVKYARKIMFINGYTVTFENAIYGVNLYGANHNILDVLNLNSVSIRTQNSAGLQTVYIDKNVLTEEERAKLMSLPNEAAIADAVWNAEIGE